jgi:hypothetical protein
MAEKEKQRISWKGLGVILVLGAITYILVREGQLLYLYSLATVMVVGLLVAAAFDLGLAKSGQAPAQTEPEQAEAPVIEPPKLKNQKKRR